MKCDSRQPSCHACELHGQLCVYDELPRRPRWAIICILSFSSAANILHRPSNSRIKELVEENERLRLSLALSQTQVEPEGPLSALTPDNVSAPHESTVSASRDNAEQQQQPAYSQHANVDTRTTHSNTREAARPSLRETSTIRNAQTLLSLSETKNVHQSNDAEPRYHGPTSTLFEDTGTDRRLHHNIPAAPRLPSAWVQKGLMAEAAHQRIYTFSHIHLSAVRTPPPF